MSYCELCGRQAAEKKKIIVDGTVFNVCIACSKHGKPYVPAQVSSSSSSSSSSSAKKKKPVAKIQQQKKIITMVDETMIDPDFARLIREARMKMGLTHEQLGMKMSEKAQILKKFETGALKPDELFAKKLERYLGIKLYVSISNNNSSSSDDEK
jgi:putative transcription factor